MTFVVESMAAANAILRNRRVKALSQENNSEITSDRTNLINEDTEEETCDIQERVEMVRILNFTQFLTYFMMSIFYSLHLQGRLARLFFNKGNL